MEVAGKVDAGRLVAQSERVCTVFQSLKKDLCYPVALWASKAAFPHSGAIPCQVVQVAVSLRDPESQLASSSVSTSAG